MAKAKKTKGNGATVDVAALELKVERMEVLSMAQDLETISTQINALRIKIQGMQSETALADHNLKDLQTKGQDLVSKFQQRLDVLKVKFNVPEGKNLDLRTGEFVDQPEPQEAAQQPQQQ